MKYSRREVWFWIPAMVAAHGLAAEAPIPSKMLRFEDLPVESGDNRALRRILKGKTHSGYQIDHLSFSYSSLACFRMGMSGSASFQKARKSW